MILLFGEPDGWNSIVVYLFGAVLIAISWAIKKLKLWLTKIDLKIDEQTDASVVERIIRHKLDYWPPISKWLMDKFCAHPLIISAVFYLAVLCVNLEWWYVVIYIVPIVALLFIILIWPIAIIELLLRIIYHSVNNYYLRSKHNKSQNVSI